MAGLATRLAAEGMNVFLVDLSHSGGLELALEQRPDQQEDSSSWESARCLPT